MSQKKITQGLLMAMAAGICWGTTGLFGTILFEKGFEPLLIASVRVFFSLLVFLVVFLSRYRSRLSVPWNELVWLAFFSFVGVHLFNIFYLQAIEQVGISVAVVLLYTSPLFVVLFSSILLGEKITWVKLTSIILLLTGTFFVVQAYQVSLFMLNFSGILLGLGAGLTFGLLSVFSKISLVKADQLAKIFYLFLFGSVFLSFVCPPWLIFEYEFTFAAFLALSGLVVIATIAAYTLYILGLTRLEAGQGSIAVAVEPVAAIMFAFIFMGEVLSFGQYLGVGLVLCGIYLVST